MYRHFYHDRGRRTINLFATHAKTSSGKFTLSRVSTSEKLHSESFDQTNRSDDSGVSRSSRMCNWKPSTPKMNFNRWIFCSICYQNEELEKTQEIRSIFIYYLIGCDDNAVSISRINFNQSLDIFNSDVMEWKCDVGICVTAVMSLGL